MPKTSHIPLPPLDEQNLFVQLARLFTNKTTLDTEALLNELLGREEKLMLSKRFAIIALLWKKQTLYSIAKKLHVSSSTVARIHDRYHLGIYDHILDSFEKPTPAIIEILETIDGILHLGGLLPHYGQTHRSEAYHKAKAAKQRRRQPFYR